jgi:hypothetical protein
MNIFFGSAILLVIGIAAYGIYDTITSDTFDTPD